jgi:2-polyprenyl-3-methyl-5-hydroxy-6-metoxy-1,4-benzoquinol methylase
MFKILEQCLCCGNNSINKFLNLGIQPLANNLLKDESGITPEFPLEVKYCSTCWHSQLSISVDPKTLFADYYYVTGTSKTMHLYCEQMAEMIFNFRNQTHSKILDIASNDGTFLDKFNKYGWDLYGIDPAQNLKVSSEEKGINTFINFFGSDVIEFGTKFDVITALNVFAHVPNPLKFLRECKKNLTKTGVIFIQTSQRDMVERRQFDTVYHEHISFFSVKSIQAICKRAGLYLNDIKLADIHGGSYIFCISKENKIASTVLKRITQEEISGRYDANVYKTFQEEISSLEMKTKNLFKNDKMIAFGAAAKGIVALHSLDLNPEFIIDENPLKIGKILPKKLIPIVGIESLKKYPSPLDIIILPWNFKEEITQKIRNIRGNKDNLICIFNKEKNLT